MLGNLSSLIGSTRQVVNLSSRQLMQDELIILCLWLKFIQNPTHEYISSAPIQILADIEATFNKYVWPKEIFVSVAQKNIFNPSPSVQNFIIIYMYRLWELFLGLRGQGYWTIPSQYFPTAPFPVWTNHPNMKGILSYKHKFFQEVHSNWEHQKFIP